MDYKDVLDTGSMIAGNDVSWFVAMVIILFLVSGVVVAFASVLKDTIDYWEASTKGIKRIFSDNAKTLIFGVVAVIAVVLLVGYASGVRKDTEALVQVQKDDFTHNISLKYDVDKVVFDGTNPFSGKRYKLDVGKSDTQPILLVKNGKEYLFTLSQNLETSEPTLENLPVVGGMSPDESSSVNSLLNK